MRILLANLPREGETKDYTTREYLLSDYTRYPPLGLLAIAADVNPKHSITVLDVVVSNMSIEEVVQYITDYRPDVLGLSVVTRRLYSLWEVSRRVRESLPDTTIVAGGPHVNYWPEETMHLGTVDFVLPGYGERSFPLLVDAMEAGGEPQLLTNVPNLYYRSQDGHIHSNPPEEMPIILDSLPFPNRRLINLNDYYTAVDKARMTTMYSSRGCPFHCVYCDVQEKKFCYRTAKSVVDEFEQIIGLGIGEIHIFDDTFNVRPQRVKDICSEILQRNLRVRWSSRARVVPFDREMMRLLKEAGCTRLHIGVESLDPAILKYMNKSQTLEQIHSFFQLCREFDMETLAYFIIGFPGETGEYREGLLREVVKLGTTYAFCNILYPLPKTQYYRSLLDSGTFKEDFWAGFLREPKRDFELPLPRTPQLQKELEVLADDFHRKFCLRPKFIWRELRKCLLSPRMLLTKTKLGLLLLFSGLRQERLLPRDKKG